MHIYNRYQKVVACADKAKEIFKARYPNVKWSSIPNGVNISIYKEAQPYTKQELAAIPEESLLATMLARFDYPKRQDTLVEAIAQLPNKYHAILVGGIPNNPGLLKIQELTRSLGVSHRLHFLYIFAQMY